MAQRSCSTQRAQVTSGGSTNQVSTSPATCSALVKYRYGSGPFGFDSPGCTADDVWVLNWDCN